MKLQLLHTIRARFSVSRSFARAAGASTRNSPAEKYPCSAKPRTERAFTLVELLVSISIFAVITAVAVFNHAKFNGSVVLTNLAYEVALSIRQAQFYGITVRQTSANAAKFDSGYGVHFDLSNPTTYTIFEDVRSGGVLNHINDGSDVSVETFRIQKGNKISKICVDGSCSPTVVDISFVRPNPDAEIRAGGQSVTRYSKAELCVSSADGSTKRKVTVESTGQISVSVDAASVCN